MTEDHQQYFMGIDEDTLKKMKQEDDGQNFLEGYETEDDAFQTNQQKKTSFIPATYQKYKKSLDF